MISKSLISFALLLTASMLWSQGKVSGKKSVSGSGEIFVFSTSSIAVTPLLSGAPVGTTAQFTATLNDNLGNSTPACVNAGWSSNNLPVATIVASTGLATAVAVGTATITCTQGSLSGNATLIVEGAPNFTNPSTPCTQPCPLSSGTVGVPYGNTPLTASGATPPYTFSHTGAPPWMTFSSAGCGANIGCQLGGTPNSAVTTIFTLTVTDSLSISTSLQVSVAVQASASTGVQLPLNWAIKVVNPTFDVTRTLGSAGGSFYLCSTGDGCFAQMQQAICDWTFDGVDDNWYIKVQHGTFVQTGLAHTCTQTGSTTYNSLTFPPKIVNGGLPTKFLVIDSDTPLTAGQTVCSHNTDDTGVRQPPSGDISTWWIGTNQGCANDIGSMWTLEGNWAGSGNTGALIQGGQWDATTNLGPANVAIKDAEFRIKKGTTFGGIMVAFGRAALTSPTLISQMPTNFHLENIYSHTDATDWCNQVGGVTQYLINAGGSGYVKGDTGTINTGGGNATYSLSTVTGGVAKLMTITNGGSGYSTGTGIATTATSGVGTGMTVNIYAVAGSSPSCVTSFNTGGKGVTSVSTAFDFADCINCSLKYSYADYMVRPGAEGHTIGLTRTPGPDAFVHNWLSGQSITLFFGGEARLDPLYSITDNEVRGNRITEPPSWIGTVYQGPASGSGITFKNRLEYKACNRCLIDGNFIEFSDTSGGQSGQLLEMNPRACSAGAQCDNPQAIVQNVTITNNNMRHALSGFNMDGRSGYPTNGGGVVAPLKFVNVNNNLIYDIGNAVLYDHFRTIPQSYGVRTLSGGESYICPGTKSGNTITLTCRGGVAGLSQTQISVGDYFVVSGCSDSTWNLPGSNFPFTTPPQAQNGTLPAALTVVYNNPAAVSSSATDCVVSNQVGNPSNLTINHNTFVTDSTIGAINNMQNYQGIVRGVFTDTGCSGAGPAHSTAITSLARANGVVTAGLANTSGWTTAISAANNQTIVEVTGMTPADLNGKFYFLGPGTAGTATWSQAGANENGTAFGTAAQMGTCPTNTFQQNNVYKNNLIAANTTTAAACPNTPAGGWLGLAASGDGDLEGCPNGFTATGCSENFLDPVSSVITYTDFPGRCVHDKYTEMGGVNAGQRPPVTLTGPLTTVCATATADATCVGLHNMMNGVAFNGNDTFTNYVLDSTSVYHNAADDGTDFGAVPAAIETANQSTLYVCATSCGSGPNPDK